MRRLGPAARDGHDGPPASATPNETPESTPTATPVPARRTVATGLSVPWGIAFLPDGDALVAERDTGRILRIGDGRRRVAMRVPGVNTGAGEGGLLGLAVSPTYSRDRLVVRVLHVVVRQPDRAVPARRAGCGRC